MLVAAGCVLWVFEMGLGVLGFRVATGCESERGRVATGCEAGGVWVAAGCEAEGCSVAVGCEGGWG